MPPLLYAWAAVTHWRWLLVSPRDESRARRMSGRVAVAGHAVQVAAMLYLSARTPLGTMWGALSVSVLSMSCAFLLLERLARSSSLGAPYFLLASGASLLISANEGSARAVRIASSPVLFSVHVALGTSGFGLLAASGLVAGVWLLLYRLLRDRRFGEFERGMPDLASLDRLFRISSSLGTGLLAAGAVLGTAWMEGAGIPLSSVAWKSGTVFFALAWHLAVPISRRLPGFSATRAAWIGFLGLLPLLLAVWAGVRT
jgi:ABC-type uncharacterized transport system permease subunit